MAEDYDVIILGTGLKESILSGLLANVGKKVLHLDRKESPGGDTASLNLEMIYKLFYSETEPPQHLGQSRDWKIDLVPKFLTGAGKLVRLFQYLRDITDYLQFRIVEGVFLARKTGANHLKLFKVPTTNEEMSASHLMGLFEKARCREFLTYVRNYREDESDTYEGCNLHSTPFCEFASKFKLAPNCLEFIGHALAITDEYMSRPSIEIINRVKLQLESTGRFGDSAFIYPVYGLQGIVEAFIQHSTHCGTTVKLGRDVQDFVHSQTGALVGVRVDEEVVWAPVIVCDPSYATSKVRVTGQIVRAICLLNTPLRDLGDCSSCLIVIPPERCNRRHSIYISYINSAFCVCPSGFFIATCSTRVETDTPQEELQSALSLIGDMTVVFMKVEDIYESLDNNVAEKNIFVSRSYDDTPDFESVCDEVLSLYEHIVGEPLNF